MQHTVHSRLPCQRPSQDSQQPSRAGVGSPAEWAAPGQRKGLSQTEGEVQERQEEGLFSSDPWDNFPVCLACQRGRSS